MRSCRGGARLEPVVRPTNASELAGHWQYAYNTYMRVTWDPRKAAANVAKHGVRFSDAEAVLFDPVALTREDTSAEGERRFVSVGLDAIGRVDVVVFTYRAE